MLLPVLRQIEQKAPVERSPRSLRGAAWVSNSESRRPRRIKPSDDGDHPASLELCWSGCWLLQLAKDRKHWAYTGKSKGTCTGLGQINAAAFNKRPTVRDPHRNGMAVVLVGDLDFGTKGQRFVRCRHAVIVERDAARSLGSTLRRVSNCVHGCDTVFGTNWNDKQTKYKRGD